MNDKDRQLILDKGRDLARRYGDMFKKSELYWKQDLKAVGKTDEEILMEFITTAYWYGYVDGKLEDEVNCQSYE